MEYPEILIAARNCDNSLWGLADALLQAAGPPKANGFSDIGDLNKLDDIGRYLSRNDYSYSTKRLFDYRNLAYNFKLEDRHPAISFSAHEHARTPARFRAIISNAPKGTRITEAFVDQVIKAKAELDRKEKLEEKKAEAKRRAEELARKATAAEQEAKKARTVDPPYKARQKEKQAASAIKRAAHAAKAAEQASSQQAANQPLRRVNIDGHSIPGSTPVTSLNVVEIKTATPVAASSDERNKEVFTNQEKQKQEEEQEKQEAALIKKSDRIMKAAYELLIEMPSSQALKQYSSQLILVEVNIDGAVEALQKVKKRLEDSKKPVELKVVK
jgi:hypothetical protein